MPDPDDDIEWFIAGSARWATMERKFSGLVIQFSGTSFASLIGLLTLPGNVLLTTVCGVMLWASIAMICLCAFEVERCRQWQDWHKVVLANPMIWPWPPCPGHT